MMYPVVESPSLIAEASSPGNPCGDRELYTLYGFSIPADEDRRQRIASARSTLRICHGGGVAAVMERAIAPAGPGDRMALIAGLQSYQTVLEIFRQAAIPFVPVALSVPPLSLSRIESVLAAHGQRLHDAITLLNGLIELDLQATWLDVPAILKRIAATDPGIRTILSSQSDTVSSEMQVRVGALLAQALEQQRVALTKQWIKALDPVVVAIRTDLPAAPDMVVNLAVLLPAGREEDVIVIVTELSSGGGDPLRVRSIGPLVPVSFSAVQVIPVSAAQIEEDCGILGIQVARISETEVNTAYRRLAHRLHPDQAEQPDEGAFQRVAAATRRLRALVLQSGGVIRRGEDAEILELPQLKCLAREELRA